MVQEINIEKLDEVQKSFKRQQEEELKEINKKKKNDDFSFMPLDKKYTSKELLDFAINGKMSSIGIQEVTYLILNDFNDITLKDFDDELLDIFLRGLSYFVDLNENLPPVENRRGYWNKDEKDFIIAETINLFDRSNLVTTYNYPKVYDNGWFFYHSIFTKMIKEKPYDIKCTKDNKIASRLFVEYLALCFKVMSDYLPIDKKEYDIAYGLHIRPDYEDQDENTIDRKRSRFFLSAPYKLNNPLSNKLNNNKYTTRELNYIKGLKMGKKIISKMTIEQLKENENNIVGLDKTDIIKPEIEENLILNNEEDNQVLENIKRLNNGTLEATNEVVKMQEENGFNFDEEDEDEKEEIEKTEEYNFNEENEPDEETEDEIEDYFDEEEIEEKQEIAPIIEEKQEIAPIIEEKQEIAPIIDNLNAKDKKTIKEKATELNLPVSKRLSDKQYIELVKEILKIDNSFSFKEKEVKKMTKKTTKSVIEQPKSVVEQPKSVVEQPKIEVKDNYNDFSVLMNEINKLKAENEILKSDFNKRDAIKTAEIETLKKMVLDCVDLVHSYKDELIKIGKLVVEQPKSVVEQPKSVVEQPKSVVEQPKPVLTTRPHDFEDFALPEEDEEKYEEYDDEEKIDKIPLKKSSNICEVIKKITSDKAKKSSLEVKKEPNDIKPQQNNLNPVNELKTSVKQQENDNQGTVVEKPKKEKPKFTEEQIQALIRNTKLGKFTQKKTN